MSRLHFAQPVSKWPARILSAVTPSDGQPAREESHRQRVHCRHRITARKHHLPQRAGHLDLDHISIGRMDYIAEIVAEAVGQDRLSRSTLEIARNDREIETSGKQERNETA